MNRKLLLLSVVAAVALGAACVVLVQQLRGARESARAAAAVAEAEAVTRALNEERVRLVEKERARVEQQNKELADITHSLRQSEARQASNVTALVQKLGGTNAAASTAAGADAEADKGMGDMMSKMMKDPAMREMIRSQQKSLMKTMYGALFKDLKLSADDQKKLTDLMIDGQLGGVDHMGDFFSKDDAARTNAMNAVTTQQKKVNDDIKSLLGEEKFAQYEAYQKSVGDRLVLNQFQQQLGDTPLRDDQMKQLLQLMTDEKARTPPVFSEDPAHAAETYSQLASEEALNKHFKWQEEYNKRVLEGAARVLTPEQMKEFTEFQESQMNQQRLGLKMAREMFGAGKGATTPGDVPVIVVPAVK
jgi:hypothetical protein